MTDEPAPTSAVTPTSNHAAIALSRPARIWCGVVGGVLVAFAGLTLWRGQGGAATAAFVALGALFALLAIAGVVPRRIKAGNAEMESTREEVEKAAVQTADAAIGTMTRSELEAFIAQTLRSEEGDDPTGFKYKVASRAQEAADFEGAASELTLFTLAALGYGPDRVTLGNGPGSGKNYTSSVRSDGGDLVEVNIMWVASRAILSQLIFRDEPETSTLVILNAVPNLVRRFVENAATENRAVTRVVVVPAESATLTWVLRRLLGERAGSPPTTRTWTSTFPLSLA